MNRTVLVLVVIAFFVLMSCTPTPEKAIEEESGVETKNMEVSDKQKSGGIAVTSVSNGAGTLLRLWDDPPTLDPHLTTDATSAEIIVEVFGGLVTIDMDLKIVPDVAKSWDISTDGLTYTFHLNDDARFHNGKVVTAEDFKWSIERAANPATQGPVVDQYLGDIVGVKTRLSGDTRTVEGVKVIDDDTLEITVDAPKSYFLAKLTYPTAFVVDKENVESDRRWFLTPNGTGPFKLEKYLPGESMILKRHDAYHLGAPLLEGVKFILTGGVAMLMYENDEIHVTGVGLADLDRVLDPSNPLSKEVVTRPPQFSTSYIGLNLKRPPLDDANVRQALNYAINREEISKIVLADLVIPAKGILPPGFPAYNRDLRGYNYDPEKAKKLLKESKYGEDLENLPRIQLTTPGSFGAANVGLDMEVILAQWEDTLGIKVEIQQTDWPTFLQDLQRRRFQMFDIGWIADYPDPENFLDILFHSTSSSNHTNYNNAEVDGLLEQARVERNQEKRYNIYRQVEQKLIYDAPWVPLWHSGEGHVLVKSYVKNDYLPPLVIPKLRHVYFEKQ